MFQVFKNKKVEPSVLLFYLVYVQKPNNNLFTNNLYSRQLSSFANLQHINNI